MDCGGAEGDGVAFVVWPAQEPVEGLYKVSWCPDRIKVDMHGEGFGGDAAV